MRKTNILFVVIFLCLLMVNVTCEFDSFVIGTRDVVFSQTPHAPIEITTNSDFVSLGCPGDGSPTNPYVIEDMSIESVEGDSCIKVHGEVTSSYVIQNCVVSGSIAADWDPLTYACIYLGAGNGTVRGCSFSDCSIGIGIEGLDDVQINDCTFNVPDNDYHYGTQGVKVLNSSHVTIQSCEFRRDDINDSGRSISFTNVSDSHIVDSVFEFDVIIDTDYGGILETCTFNRSTLAINRISGYVIRHNTFYPYGSIILGSRTECVSVYNNTLLRCFGSGIKVGGNNSIVSDNSITGSGSRVDQGHYAIGVDVWGQNNSIFGNEINDFDFGLFSTGSRNDIHNNSIHGCAVYGIYMFEYSSNNRFYYNNVYANGVNAQDDGSNNVWDDGINTGNKWGDAWTAPYPINGTANAEDRFPIISIRWSDIVLVLIIASVSVSTIVIIVLIVRKRKT